MTDSKSTADYEPEFPPDLIDDVLLRLPAKSIGRFRCVSKPWKSLLSSPKFIKSHFNFHLHRTTPIAVVLDKDGDRYYEHKHLITFPADGSDGPSRKVTFPFLGEDDGMRVKAACHGFVLVVVQVADIWRVLNPLTFESYELPGFSVPLNDLPTFYDMFGMGYDSCSDDYKIVQIKKSAWTDEHVQTLSVGVYSLKRKCWTKVWNCPYSPVAKFDGTYTNGFLHWVAKAWEDHDVVDPDLVVIAAFNLALEIFEEVPLPKGLCNDLILCVTVLRECLAIVCRRIRGCVNVWLMRDYGVQESWHKLVINTEDMYVTTVLSLSREDEFVLIVDSDSPGGDREDRLIAGDREDRLIAYSSRTGFRRYIVYDDLPCNMLTTVSISAECLLPSSCISAE